MHRVSTVPRKSRTSLDLYHRELEAHIDIKSIKGVLTGTAQIKNTGSSDEKDKITMIEIHLYGKLRRYAKDNPSSRGSVIRIESQPDETIESLLTRVGISLDEVYSIFYNSRLLATHSKSALMVGFHQVRYNPFDWDLSLPVKAGDRIGLFGRDMALLVV